MDNFDTLASSVYFSSGRRKKSNSRLFLRAFFFIFIFSFITPDISGQAVDVNASIDTNFLLIGEQTQIELRVQYKLDGEQLQVRFPELKDTINEFIEVIHSSPIDTVYPNPNDLSFIEQKQRITITSFDSGHYEIPYFEFFINEQPYQTGPLFIQVQTLPVDTAEAIFDIKKPMEEPFSLTDWIKENWVWMTGVLVVLAGLIWLYLYLKNKPKEIVEEVKPDTPYYVIALNKLEKLRNEQLWQSGKIKTYHSGISEIIREYLENRYQISALENTTDEIMQSLRFHSIPQETLVKLNHILTLTDLVKFAKEQPLASENENCMISSMDFINNTKPIIDLENDVE